MLVGVGTAICGASAIAAVSGAVRPREAELRYAISTIFLFNLVAVLTFPALGHLLGMSQSSFGLWAGTAVNDASSAVAAGLAYGDVAASHAVIVKLTRTLMIVPISLALAFVAVRRDASGESPLRVARRAFPWFILFFLLASAAAHHRARRRRRHAGDHARRADPDHGRDGGGRAVQRPARDARDRAAPARARRARVG